MKKSKKLINKEKYQLLALIILQGTIFCTKITYLKNYLEITYHTAIAILIIAAIYSLLKKNIPRRKALIFLMLLIVGIASFACTNDFTLCFIPLFALMYISTDKKQIIKNDLIAKIVVTMFIFTNYILGFTEQYSYVRNGVERGTLGFAHPNAIGFMFATIVIDYLYLISKTKTRLIVRLAPLIITIPVLMISDSRTSILIIALIYINNFLSNRNRKTATIIRNKIFLLTPILLCALSILFTQLLCIKNEFAIELDEQLSYRISWQKYYHDKKDITILGEQIQFSGYPLDNGYYRLLYGFGIIGLIEILSLSVIALKHSQIYDKELNGILLILLIYALSEWVVFRIPISPYLIISLTDTMKGGKK